MRPTQSLAQLAFCIFAFSPVATASGSPRRAPEFDALVVRADGNTASPGSTSTGSAASQTGDSTATGSNTGGDNLNTAKPTPTGKDGSTKSGDTTHTQFGAQDPPAGVSMVTPNPALSPSGLYKINDFVTWSWNYTSLQGTPTAIDILVSCSTASQTWTLASNMSFETGVSYTWDTSKQAADVNKPLLVAMYTLLVKDSAANITAAPEAGYLNVAAGYTFGLYTPQAYTPYPDWVCTGSCSAATSLFNRETLGLAVVMSVVTIMSFSWFVSGLGLH